MVEYRIAFGASPPYEDLVGLDTIESEQSDRDFPSIGESSDELPMVGSGKVGAHEKVGENGDCPLW